MPRPVHRPKLLFFSSFFSDDVEAEVVLLFFCFLMTWKLVFVVFLMTLEVHSPKAGCFLFF